MNDLIRAKIIELVPEILEVKQGCAVAIKSAYSGWGDRMMGRYGTSDWMFDGISHLRNKEGTMSFDEYLNHVELCYVIGRPIQLADVLRAIAAMNLVETVTVDENGSFTTFLKGAANLHKDIPSFDLTLDFDNQDQPTRDFIGRLLGVTT